MRRRDSCFYFIGDSHDNNTKSPGIKESDDNTADIFILEKTVKKVSYKLTDNTCGKPSRSWKRNSRASAGKRRITSYEHSKTSVQKISPYGGLCFHFPNKSLCVPVRANVSTSTSSSMR